MHNLITAALYAVLLTTAIGVVYLVIDAQVSRHTLARLTRPAWWLLGTVLLWLARQAMHLAARHDDPDREWGTFWDRLFDEADALESRLLRSHRICVALGRVDTRCAQAAERTYWELDVDCNGHRCGECDACVEYGRERLVGVCH